MYRAALVDIDGTLVDSNDAHARAWVAALAAALAICDSPRDLVDHYLLSPFKRPPLPVPSA